MDKKERKPLFTVTAKDCVINTFCTGGPGGQNQNRKEKGVRFTHPPSGAVGEAREHRSQEANKKAAWERMGNSKQFQVWAKRKAAEMQGQKTTEEMVEEAMLPSKIKTEILDENQKWQMCKPEELTDEDGAVRLSVEL